jgi:hypothetical protein
MVDIMSGEIQDTVSPKKKNPKTKGRAGGLKGGKARAAIIPQSHIRPTDHFQTDTLPGAG